VTVARPPLRGPGGCQVFVESAHDAPLVWLEVAVHGGAAADPVGLEGFHRHMAYLARRGARTAGGELLDRHGLDDALDALGASLDVTPWRDAVSFSGLALSRNLDRLVELTAAVLARPTMAPEEHDKLLRETGFLLDELRDDDGDLATRFFDRHCCPGHPYGRTSIGTEGTLAALGASRDTVVATAAAEVVPANLVIGFAGDVDERRALALAEVLVSGLSDRSAPARPVVELGGPAPAGRRLIVVDKPDRSQSQLRLGHLGPRYGADDAIALAIVETAFGGMFSSRLMQEVRVQRGWSYGAGIGLRRARGSHWLEMHLAPAIDVTADALALVIRLYEELAAGGLKEEEIEFAKGYLAGSLPFHLATARQRLGIAVRNAVFDVPYDFVHTMPERLTAVTNAEIRGAIDRWIRPQDLVSVVVSTADTIAEKLEGVGAGKLEVIAFDAY
jgi:zinc protease